MENDSTRLKQLYDNVTCSPEFKKRALLHLQEAQRQKEQQRMENNSKQNDTEKDVYMTSLHEQKHRSYLFVKLAAACIAISVVCLTIFHIQGLQNEPNQRPAANGPKITNVPSVTNVPTPTIIPTVTVIPETEAANITKTLDSISFGLSQEQVKQILVKAQITFQDVVNNKQQIAVMNTSAEIPYQEALICFSKDDRMENIMITADHSLDSKISVGDSKEIVDSAYQSEGFVIPIVSNSAAWIEYKQDGYYLLISMENDIVTQIEKTMYSRRAVKYADLINKALNYKVDPSVWYTENTAMYRVDNGVTKEMYAYDIISDTPCSQCNAVVIEFSTVQDNQKTRKGLYLVIFDKAYDQIIENVMVLPLIYNMDYHMMEDDEIPTISYFSTLKDNEGKVYQTTEGKVTLHENVWILDDTAWIQRKSILIMQAYMSGDISTVKSLLRKDATEILVYQRNILSDVDHIVLKCYLQNIKDGGPMEVQVEFTEPGEDSYTYLDLMFKKMNGQYEATEMYLEK